MMRTPDFIFSNWASPIIPADALPYLERAATLPLPDARFARENLRLLALCAYLAGHRERARAVATRLRDAADTPEALRLEEADLLRRIEFDERGR